MWLHQLFHILLVILFCNYYYLALRATLPNPENNTISSSNILHASLNLGRFISFIFSEIHIFVTILRKLGVWYTPVRVMLYGSCTRPMLLSRVVLLKFSCFNALIGYIQTPNGSLTSTMPKVREKPGLKAGANTNVKSHPEVTYTMQLAEVRTQLRLIRAPPQISFWSCDVMWTCHGN